MVRPQIVRAGHFYGVKLFASMCGIDCPCLLPLRRQQDRPDCLKGLCPRLNLSSPVGITAQEQRTREARVDVRGRCCVLLKVMQKVDARAEHIKAADVAHSLDLGGARPAYAIGTTGSSRN
jgi:hypothetical protein